MDILNKIDFLLKEATCTGDIATNTAKGSIDVIGAPKKRKRKKMRSKLTGNIVIDKETK